MCLILLQITTNTEQKSSKVKEFFENVSVGIRRHRTKIYCLIYLWKIILALVMVTMIFSINCQSGSSCVNALYGEVDLAVLKAGLFPVIQALSNLDLSSCTIGQPYHIALINVSSSMFCYL